jgi:hypothetical protein
MQGSNCSLYAESSPIGPNADRVLQASATAIFSDRQQTSATQNPVATASEALFTDQGTFRV